MEVAARPIGTPKWTSVPRRFAVVIACIAENSVRWASAAPTTGSVSSTKRRAMVAPKTRAARLTANPVQSLVGKPSRSAQRSPARCRTSEVGTPARLLCGSQSRMSANVASARAVPASDGPQ